MKLISRNGYFRGPIVDHAIGVTKNSGLARWEVQVRATEEFDFTENEWRPFTDENCDVTGFLCMVSTKNELTFNVKDIMHAVEWDGRSSVALGQMDLADVGIQFAVAMETYEGKTNPVVKKIAHFDDVPQSGSIRKLDDATFRSVTSQFDALLKKNAPAKAVSAPAAAAPAKASAPAALPPKPKASKKAAAPVAPPVEDDIPFEETADLPAEDEVDAAAEAVAEEPTAAPAAVPGPKSKVTKKGMTKDEAWAHCVQMKAKNITNDELTKSWRIAVKNVGKKETEFTPADWDTVCENVMAEHGVF